ncbi:hypothetical protein CDA63_04780 [Hymenobacter amundsenii]|uniref:Carboxypeptidase-like regulatory domain-containing protein n=1 Tax=Hymenobacter amundsenii TaxID=2006685 RepID=A0A246FNQ4_9BACT|nr:carboxypeptidase-like regulatory domain-containing protein [Hymenobacter amundsenii]OWP64352.1 hypothetical protein CDA63_04780 [Hymenobacter amundsenii]
MPHSLTLTIPEPCHESWAAMTPAAQGRHCAACAKTVVDFSCMTDAQVVAWLSRQAAGATCGRFATPQLHRPLATGATTGWPRTLAALLALLGLGAAAPAIAQIPRPQTLTEQTLSMGIVATQPQAVLPVRVVQGRVTDASTGLGLPGVAVLVEGTHYGTSTRADGTYELDVPTSLHSPQLVFSSIGFEMTVEPIGLASTVKSVNMKMDDTLMGEVVYTDTARWYTPRGLWQRLTRPFRRQTNR